MVVDQKMFVETIAQKAKELAQKKSSDALKSSEILVENMKEKLSQDVSKTLELLKIIVDTEFAKTRGLFKCVSP